MGVYHLFWLLKNKHSNCLVEITRARAPTLSYHKQIADTLSRKNRCLLIDLNGIIHTAAQTIFPQSSKAVPKTEGELHRAFHNEVQKSIDSIVRMVSPTELVVAIDGVAPMSKQKQQRQRRFKSSKERQERVNAGEKNVFDSTCITPGTVFLNSLSASLNKWIKRKLEKDTRWSGMDVVFSNEKVPGEGEHKLMDYVRSKSKETQQETDYLICGNDGDLFFLGLATMVPHFYIIRENTYDRDRHVLYYFIDIPKFKEELLESLLEREVEESEDLTNEELEARYMETEKDMPEISEEGLIVDFITLMFMVGNDFLPNIPSLEIFSGGMERITEVYKGILDTHGHICDIDSDSITVNTKNFSAFLEIIAKEEKEMFENKHREAKHLEDSILTSCMNMSLNTTGNSTSKGVSSELDLRRYKARWYMSKLPDQTSVENLSHEYIRGMEWVIRYYVFGVKDWTWQYPYYYAPFASDLAKNALTYSSRGFESTRPNLPFQQLLYVLPPSSFNLLPTPLNEVCSSPTMEPYYPKEIEVDTMGKRKEYQGVVVLPIVDSKKLMVEYRAKLPSVSEHSMKLNRRGKTFRYVLRDGVAESEVVQM